MTLNEKTTYSPAKRPCFLRFQANISIENIFPGSPIYLQKLLKGAVFINSASLGSLQIFEGAARKFKAASKNFSGVAKVKVTVTSPAGLMNIFLNVEPCCFGA